MKIRNLLSGVKTPVRAISNREDRAISNTGDDARVRASLRVLVPLLAVFVPGVAIVGLAVGRVGPEVFPLVQAVAFASLALGALLASARWLDRRPIAEYGFELDRTWGTEFVLGAALGVGINAFVFGAALAVGWATVVESTVAGEEFGFATGFVVALVAFALVGFWEETLFRGILLTNAAEGLAARNVSERGALLGAVGITTLLFAFLHVNAVPSLAAFPFLLAAWLLMGGLFAFAYVATGSLAFPIGLHFTANFALNSLFGLGGKQATALPSLLGLEVTAPETLAPLDGSLVASAPHLVAILAAYLCLVGWLVARGDAAFAKGIQRR